MCGVCVCVCVCVVCVCGVCVCVVCVCVCLKAREGKWGEESTGVIIYWLVMWEIDRTKLPENGLIERTKQAESKEKSAVSGKM